MKGESAKAGLVEARARAYAAYVSGQSAKAEIGIKNQQSQIAIQELRLKAYVANLDKDKVLLQAQLGGITTNAEAHRANTARYTAAAGVQSERVRLQIQASEAGMRTSVSVYEVEIRRYIADMEQMIRAAGLQLEALKAAGQASATLAAGAMAGISISASAGADARIGASGSENISINVPAAPIVM